MYKLLALLAVLITALSASGHTSSSAAWQEPPDIREYNLYLPFISQIKTIYILHPRADAEIRCCGASGNFGDRYMMGVGYDLDESAPVRTLIAFDNAPLPDDQTVYRASLYLYHQYWYGKPYQTRTVAVSGLLSPWEEQKVSWFNQPESGETAAEFTLTTEMESFGYHAVDVTALVHDWQHHGVENYGLVLVSDESSASPIVFRFSSREGDYPPYLVVDCTPPGR